MSRRLGLLACDAIWEPLRSRHGDYAEMIAAWLQATGAEFELIPYAAHAGQLPTRVQDCDAWIVSGSRAGVYEALPWIAPLMDFVRAASAARSPLLGICFGHQLLAEALGGRTTRAPGGWGLGNIRVQLRDGVAGPAPRAGLDLFMAHQDQVVALPPGAAWLGGAAHCPHAMFALGDHVLGLQPHPEFTAEFMHEMTLDESLQIADALRTGALDSYGRPVDSATVGTWVAAFLGLQSSPAAAAWAQWHSPAGMV